MAADDEAARNIVENLTHFLAELAHRLAAMGAGALGRMDDLLARQMLRQGPPLRLAFRRCRLGRRRDEFGLRRLQIFDQKFKLIEALRLRAEAMALHRGELQRQLLDQEPLLDDQLLQRLNVVGEQVRRHAAIMPCVAWDGNPAALDFLPQPTRVGCAACCAARVSRQSIPSSRLMSCAAVTETLPSFAAGQVNDPFSMRL